MLFNWRQLRCTPMVGSDGLFRLASRPGFVEESWVAGARQQDA